MCKIDFYYISEQITLHWFMDMLFVYGDAVVYAVISFFRMSGTIRVLRGDTVESESMNVVNIVIFSIQTFKYISMS